MDESLAEWALAQLYDDLGQRRPPVVWVDSPGEAARAIGDAGARELVTAPYGGVSMWPRRGDAGQAWDPLSRGVGVVTVAPDAVAYLEQPGHVPLACAPGAYLLRLV
ncbi:hypothetical protein OHS71_39080 [Streptomyces sp. NBC_00377]|uniref:hypothetical protein n=1 Tax=unclassified Streptomyces TaxID=2593676 RepID=UPI002E1E8640|nr:MULTISPECIES: hypothetical protein [unclassified Streptomyces]